MDGSQLLEKFASEANENGSAVKAVENDGYSFSLILAEYPDIIIEKKRDTANGKPAKKTQYLIIMPSAGHIFIKTIVQGSEPVSEALTESNYSAFTSKMPDIELPEGFWTKSISKGKKEYEKLFKMMEDDLLLEIIRKKLSDGTDVINSRKKISEIKVAYSLLPKLITEYKDRKKVYSFICREPVFVKDIEDTFGIQNARNFLDTYEESIVTETNEWDPLWMYETASRDYEDENIKCYNRQPAYGGIDDVRTKRPYITMEYKSFRDYILYHSVEEGFADNIGGFVEQWSDCLNMQFLIYGKIRDKYPKHMACMHNVLSYKMRIMKQEIDEKRFQKNVKRAEVFEGKCGDYVFIAPKSKQDMLDEATAQANCLASHVNKFINGEELILFMRKKKTPENSYITLSIINNRISQFYLAHNRTPQRDLRELADRWVDTCLKKQEETKAQEQKAS